MCSTYTDSKFFFVFFFTAVKQKQIKLCPCFLKMINKIKKYRDEDLLELIAKDKEPEKSEAFSEIYSRYSKSIYLYCRKIFSGESYGEDLFQETFMQFLNAVKKNPNISNVKGYLLRIARNLALNIKRTKKIETLEFDELRYLFNDKNFEKQELGELIDSALNLLSEEHKEAFMLQAYHGLKYHEIAELTEVPISTVRNRVVRAKAKLREILTPVLHERI